MAEFAETDYGPMIRRVNEIMKLAQHNALPAEVISKLIHKIIQAWRPKPQYIVHSHRWSAVPLDASLSQMNHA